MRYALINSENIVVNIIVWDGVEIYESPEGLTVRQVNPWIGIGDDADKAGM